MRSHYERLTQLDASFLVYEGPHAPMHVGLTQIHEAGPLQRPGGGIDVERIEAWIESRLHRVPRYRQRLAHTPIERHPIWIDDPHFNLHYHVRHTRLPHPGDERQLKRLAGRILSQHLDRAKPLWEVWVVEGLAGDRFALVSKTHHCMVDGVAGAELVAQLLSPEPTGTIPPAPPFLPRPAPSGAQLVRDGAIRTLGLPLAAAGALWRVARDRGGARAALEERLGALGRAAASVVTGPPAPTPLNQPIGPHRRIDWLTMDLGAVRRVAKSAGATVNDVVLATAAGGVGRYLRRVRQEDVDRIDFRVMTPVSVRAAAERGRTGNRVAAWIVPLPLGERDPRRRLEQVRARTEALKRSHAELATDTLAQITEWTEPALFSLGSLLIARSVPFHMVVTNVPGPQLPLYLLGARMLEAHPMVPLLGLLSTGIALLSYDGRLSWGFSADWDLVPDLHDLVDAVDVAFRRLAAACGESP